VDRSFLILSERLSSATRSS